MDKGQHPNKVIIDNLSYNKVFPIRLGTYTNCKQPNVTLPMMQILRFFWPSLLWLAIITFLSTKGGIQLPHFDLIGTDKLGHAFFYGVQVLLFIRGLRQMRLSQGQIITKQQAFWAFGLCVAYGVLMEFVQYKFFPGRFYEVDDMLANSIGAGIGWMLARLRLPKLQLL